MATYFVRKTGNDANSTAQAQVAATAWLTIDKAANEVAAGDTVVVGAGVYRESVTMDTAGSSGSLITYVADVDGALGSGDPGLVIISAYTTESGTATRTLCVDPNEKEWIVWRGFVFTGGTLGCFYKFGAVNVNYEGCIWEDCVFVSGHTASDRGILINFNAATTPTGDGPIFRRCVFDGNGTELVWDGNVTAEQNLKIAVDSCLFIGAPVSNTYSAGVFFTEGTGSTFGSGGVAITNCTFIGRKYGVYVDHNTSTTYPVDVRNCVFQNVNIALTKQTSDDAALTSDFNTFASCATPYTNVTAGANDSSNLSDPGLLGGMGDFPLWRFWGWSPYRPWEPIRLQDDTYVHAVIGAADAAVAPAFDLYDEARPMAGRAGSRTDLYYFDASDAGPTDNDAAWTNDANAFDGDSGTLASTTTAGTETTNELRGEGTNAPATGGAIQSVTVRMYVGQVTGDLAYWKIYTDSEGEVLLNDTGTAGDDTWTSVYTLTTPSGGWTWAKVQALEFIVYADPSITLTEIGAIEATVTSTPDSDDDRGAVEGRARPELETTTVRTGSNAVRFEGAGFHDMFIPVGTSLTTVDVYAQHDGSYTGTLPQLQALNIPGVADQTDVQTGASGSFEKLTVTFTATSDGIARIRLVSNDTSAAGECFFDDLAVS